MKECDYRDDFFGYYALVNSDNHIAFDKEDGRPYIFIDKKMAEFALEDFKMQGMEYRIRVIDINWGDNDDEECFKFWLDTKADSEMKDCKEKEK